jgi:hypothetical protein
VHEEAQVGHRRDLFQRHHWFPKAMHTHENVLANVETVCTG